MVVEQQGDLLVLRDLAGCRRALRVTDISEVRDQDDTYLETVVLPDDFDEVLPLVLARWDRR
ncbi:hypothetical protein EI613_32715 (plasmid) [Azospirillum sp. 412522]|nr:hypothetical protein [Azospirillum sp. 412522]MBY6266608.1 hypothetical protein [Azospirillum sp. 412522]